MKRKTERSKEAISVPVYEFECRQCGKNAGTYMDMDESVPIGDVDPRIVCPDCNLPMHRMPSVPEINGDLPSRFGFYDNELGREVFDKTDLEEGMKKKGMCHYEPDPEMKKHRDEAKYIREHSEPTQESKAAIKEQQKTAHKKRMKRNVREHLSQVKL